MVVQKERRYDDIMASTESVTCSLADARKILRCGWKRLHDEYLAMGKIRSIGNGNSYRLVLSDVLRYCYSYSARGLI